MPRLTAATGVALALAIVLFIAFRLTLDGDVSELRTLGAQLITP
jgi:HAMP domain-containing protein